MRNAASLATTCYEGSMLKKIFHESYRIVAVSVVGDDRTAVRLHRNSHWAYHHECLLIRLNRHRGIARKFPQCRNQQIRNLQYDLLVMLTAK